MNYQIFCALTSIVSLIRLIMILCSKNGRRIKIRQLTTYTIVNIFLFVALACGLYRLQSSEYKYSHFEYDKTIAVKDIYYGEITDEYLATVEDMNGNIYQYNYFDITSEDPKKLYIGWDIYRSDFLRILYLDKRYNSCTDNKELVKNKQNLAERIARMIWPGDEEYSIAKKEEKEKD